jgi:hypothetical protein
MENIKREAPLFMLMMNPIHAKKEIWCGSLPASDIPKPSLG